MPDTVTYPGSDYYEIAVREYSEKLHSDLPADPAARLRAAQPRARTRAGATPCGPRAIHYLGPLIRARRGRPVRIKFVNQLPPGEAGDLFLPVDTTTTGAGAGPLGGDDVYPQNRASLHLHGGLTPWISGGSQYQWITPAGERSPYRSGPSLVNVPDMWFDAQGRPVREGTPGATNDPGPGATTLYFPNDQSARFLYLHDDTYGLTRLSVYAGEAAPYFIGDDVEDELVAGNTGEPAVEPGHRRAGRAPAPSRPPSCRSSSRTRRSSPTPSSSASRTRPGTSPAGEASAPSGIRTCTCPTRTPTGTTALNAKGRWDYLPWYWTGLRRDGERPRGQPALRDRRRPSPRRTRARPTPRWCRTRSSTRCSSTAPRTPTSRSERKAYRLRILNACGDRQLNLQLYYARSDSVAETGPGRHARAADRLGRGRHAAGACRPIERRLAGALADGRARGRRAGPARRRPDDDPDRQRRRPPAAGRAAQEHAGRPRVPHAQRRRIRRWASSPPIIAVTGKTLYLAPGERADVIVDFSQVPAGSKLILYNDAPAPAPNGDSRVDYYTGDVDQTAIGGAPATRRRATDPTRARSCSSRSTARPRRRSTSSGCSAPCRPPTRPRRTPSWSRRPRYDAVYGATAAQETASPRLAGRRRRRTATRRRTRARSRSRLSAAATG